MGKASKSSVMLTDTIKSDSSVGRSSRVLLKLFTAALLFLMGLRGTATGGGGAGHTVLLSNRGRWSAQWWGCSGGNRQDIS